MASSPPFDITTTIKQSPPINVSQPYDPATLLHKTILITGGANGLGAHMVRHWASHGAHIIIADVDSSSAEALVAQLRQLYSSSTFAYVLCDVTSWDDQTALFAEAVRLSPSHAIDIVVPNAGIIQSTQGLRFEHPSLVNGVIPKPSTKTIDVNITGVIYTTHLALYYFSQNPRPDKCLLLIGSIASICPLAGQTHYTMSKHAVCGLFRSLRMTSFMQSPGTGSTLRVNMLAPYFVEGSRMLPLAGEIAFLAGTAGGASISDVVDAATRLVADESVSGRALGVGPPLKDAPEGEVPVAEHEGGGKGRASWEIYAHDYEEVDAFTRRYIHMMNTITLARGLFAWVIDFCVKIFRR